MTILLATGCNNAQHPFYEEIASIALCTETAFSPRKRRTQGPFGPIIGRFYAAGAGKGPQRGPFGEQLRTDALDAIPAYLLAFFQQHAQLGLDGSQSLLHRCPIAASLPKGVPDIKQPVDLLQHLVGPG